MSDLLAEDNSADGSLSGIRHESGAGVGMNDE
jgi:hypothetical protein